MKNKTISFFHYSMSYNRLYKFLLEKRTECKTLTNYHIDIDINLKIIYSALKNMSKLFFSKCHIFFYYLYFIKNLTP